MTDQVTEMMESFLANRGLDTQSEPEPAQGPLSQGLEAQPEKQEPEQNSAQPEEQDSQAQAPTQAGPDPELVAQLQAAQAELERLKNPLPPPDVGDPTEAFGPTVGQALKDNGVNWDILASRFFRLGELDPADAQALNTAGVSQSLVQGWLSSRVNQHEQELRQQAESPAPAQLSQEDKVAIVQKFGGPQAVKQLDAWAEKNYSPERIQGLNKIMASGDRAMMEFALEQVQAKYKASLGNEGQRLAGTTVSEAPLRDSKEIQKLMRDPRYFKDPEYKAKVVARIIAS